ncbi:TniB family NTP-binding protein [Inquilinus sp. CAU 1745]|uniref:TniB family NTP-binding protein n=1 Tax=Inquilinus sp. CAU 1745 TaxID=3140369 RepID=UPI00325BA10D
MDTHNAQPSQATPIIPEHATSALPILGAEDARFEEYEQKIRGLKRVYVPHPVARHVLNSLDRLMRYGNLGLEVGSPSRCVLLTGLSGSGKTALLLRWARQFGVDTAGLKDRLGVLYVEVPPSCTPKALAEHMLRALGVPEALVAKGTEVSLTERVKHHLREQEVRVVILDEFQHLIDSKSQRVIYRAADFVKGLLNAAICPFVLAGTPEAAAVYEENVQLKRRSVGRYSLKPFDWNVQAEQDFFRAAIDEYEPHLPFGKPSRLARKSIALRIHYFSNGLFGRAVDLLVAAAIRGLEEGAECLSDDLLRETVEDFRDDTNPDWFNPFDSEELKPLKAPEVDERRSRVTRLRKGKRAVRQADVLPA